MDIWKTLTLVMAGAVAWLFFEKYFGEPAATKKPEPLATNQSTALTFDQEVAQMLNKEGM